MNKGKKVVLICLGIILLISCIFLILQRQKDRDPNPSPETNTETETEAAPGMEPDIITDDTKQPASKPQKTKNKNKKKKKTEPKAEKQFEDNLTDSNLQGADAIDQANAKGHKNELPMDILDSAP